MLRPFAVSVSLIVLTLTASCAQEITPGSVDREVTEQIIREYILANPEIIEDALIALNEKRQIEEAQASRVAVVENADLLFNTSADYSIGPDDAPVTIVEFFDYRCPPCRASMTTVTALPERYNGKVRVVFKEFPILSPESRIAAVATLAAGRQGKYQEMHQAMMRSPSRFTEADIIKVAEKLDLDMDRWETDRKDATLRDQIDANYALAQAIGANATPTFVIGDTLFSGLDLAQLERLIADGIAKAS